MITITITTVTVTMMKQKPLNPSIELINVATAIVIIDIKTLYIKVLVFLQIYFAEVITIINNINKINQITV